jgi:DNA-3-methyladenine glycosylase II
LPGVALHTAVDDVAARDPVLAALVARAGLLRHRPRDPDGPLSAPSSSSSSPARPHKQLRDFSAKTLDGTVVLTRTSGRSGEELIARLTAVRGIGRWTAEMYLIFQLRRLDVWPVGDLGVRRGAGGTDPALR